MWVKQKRRKDVAKRNTIRNSWIPTTVEFKEFKKKTKDKKTNRLDLVEIKFYGRSNGSGGQLIKFGFPNLINEIWLKFQT